MVEGFWTKWTQTDSMRTCRCWLLRLLLVVLLPATPELQGTASASAVVASAARPLQLIPDGAGTDKLPFPTAESPVMSWELAVADAATAPCHILGWSSGCRSWRWSMASVVKEWV